MPQSTWSAFSALSTVLKYEPSYHVLTPRHEALVDDLGSIVATGVDMDALLHDRVGASS
jgi:hypothetical protein